MTEYYIVHASDDIRYCQVDDVPSSIEETGWRLAEGQRMDHRYPADVRFDMGDISPGIKVPDMIRNTIAYCLVSARLKALLDGHTGVETEFLPFALYNHRRRVAAKECWIVNPIGTEDCVNLTATEARASAVEPDKFLSMSRLEVDEHRISKGARLFRIRQMPHVLVIREDLRADLDRAAPPLMGVDYVRMGEPYRFD